MDKFQVTGALKYLETDFGRSPSVQEIADYLGVSSATAWKYLKEAVREGLIAESDGKYMSLGVARAYRQKE